MVANCADAAAQTYGFHLDLCAMQHKTNWNLANLRNAQMCSNIDATMKVWGEVSKGVQAIAAETADYSRKSFEESSAVAKKLLGR